MNPKENDFEGYSYSWSQMMELRNQWMQLAQNLLLEVELEELEDLDATVKGDDQPWAYNAIMESYKKHRG